MVDYFALLDLPRQPWLDPEALKERFVTLSARHHPDKAAADAERGSAEAHYAQLNAAYQTLRDTRTRLGHLIHLVTGQPPGNIRQVSPESADLFFEVGTLCRQVDAFIAAQAAATSPLLKAGLFAKGLDWIDRLKSLLEPITRKRTALEEEVRAMNSLRFSAPPTANPTAIEPSEVGGGNIARLEEIYRQLSYLTRWTAQLQERIVQLSV